MKEREITSEEKLVRGTLVAATVLAGAEIVLGLPRNPMVDLTAAIAILNVAGVPATPMLEAIKSTWKDLANK